MMLELRLALVFISLVASIKCSMDPFVIGGKKAKITDFPHSVSFSAHCIYKNHPSNVTRWMWNCGASIVNEKIILTAAHCLQGENCVHIDFSASAGHANRRKGFECSVIDYYIHPAYNNFSINNDIAIAKLKIPLKFDKTIKRIAFMKNPPYYEKAQIAGWGRFAENSQQISYDLMYTEQMVVNREYCKHRLYRLPQKTICVQSSNESYPAGGDSGSALVVRGYIQIGIVSYHLPLVSRRLEVFTDTGAFYDWIVKSTKNLYCAKVEGQ